MENNKSMGVLDLVRQEIERRIKIYHESNHGFSLRCDECEELLTFLNTLSEERDKSLEEAAEEYSKRVSDGHNYRDLTCGFIAGAEWQASQMPMPEDTVLFQKGVAEGRRLEREDMLKEAVEGEVGKDGILTLSNGEAVDLSPSLDKIAFGLQPRQKVRIVVLKVEEE